MVCILSMEMPVAPPAENWYATFEFQQDRLTKTAQDIGVGMLHVSHSHHFQSMLRRIPRFRPLRTVNAGARPLCCQRFLG